MKLEQSINRFLKGQDKYFCVGGSGYVPAIIEFELLFHEILGITNLVNHFVENKSMGYLDTSMQYIFDGSRSKGVEFRKYTIQSIHTNNGKGNPYINIHDTQLPLRNLMTNSHRQKISTESL